MKHSLSSPMAIRQRAIAFGEAVPIRRGSVSERFMTCGKPACPCHKSHDAKHGPYYSLTRQVHGSTRSRYLSADQAARAQEQIQAGREFRDAVELFWEACEKRADAELFAPDASDGPEAEKGGSTRRSASKPRGSSRR
jgi:hypothetical protein